MSQFTRLMGRETEKMADYRFDLGAEVAAIFAEYPALVGNTVFLSTAENEPGADKLRVHGRLNAPENYHPYIAEALQGYLSNCRAHDTPKAFFAETMREDGKEPFIMNVVVMMPTAPSSNPDIEAERNVKELFKLRHETGHILLPVLSQDDKERYPLIECLADSYATVSTLKKFGAAPEVLNVLEKLGASRAMNFIATGISRHLTTSATAPILEDAKKHDFTILTPDQMVKLAEKYAETFTPQQHHLNTAREVFMPVRKYADQMEDADMRPDVRELMKLTTTTTLATGDMFSFCIGAHAFHPMLNGASMNGEKALIAPEVRDALVDAYIAKAASFNQPGIISLFQQSKAENAASAVTVIDITPAPEKPPLIEGPKANKLLPAPGKPR